MRPRPSSAARWFRVTVGMPVCRGDGTKRGVAAEGTGHDASGAPFRFAFEKTFGQTPPPMSFRAAARRFPWLALLAFAVVALPAYAPAQTPLDGNGPRPRLRDTAKGAQSTQKLDDSVRKLQSDDLPTRLEGVRALGEVTDPKATDYLIAAASDPEMAVRVKAIDTLGQVKAKEATPLLIQQLIMRDTDAATKRRILASLGKIGDTRATAPILDLLARGDSEIRGNAIFALGDIGDRTAIPALEKLANNEPDRNLKALAQEAI